MEWEKYKTEIELIIKQNNVEYDLYNLVAEIFRSKNICKGKSLRDVSRRRRKKDRKGNEQVFWGIKGFPDFIILDKKYKPSIGIEEKKYVYSAIEIKYVNCSLFKKKEDIRQLVGHILWFGKVIYTNGLDWYFYKCSWEKLDKKKKIVDFQNQSYSISGTNESALDSINNYIDSFDIKDFECDEFHLGDMGEGEKFNLNKSEWDKFMQYLDL